MAHRQALDSESMGWMDLHGCHKMGPQLGTTSVKKQGNGEHLTGAWLDTDNHHY